MLTAFFCIIFMIHITLTTFLLMIIFLGLLLVSSTLRLNSSYEKSNIHPKNSRQERTFASRGKQFPKNLKNSILVYIFNLFIKCWKGEASLAEAYWKVSVLFGLLLTILILTFSVCFFPISDIINENSSYPNVIEAILLPYSLFCTICVWKCGKNSTPVLRILACIVLASSDLRGFSSFFMLIS